jgi:hypothetical protein
VITLSSEHNLSAFTDSEQKVRYISTLTFTLTFYDVASSVLKAANRLIELQPGDLAENIGAGKP